MNKIILKGRIGSRGVAEGEALVTSEKVCYIFDVDLHTGIIHDPGSTSRGQNITDKIWVYPSSRGSTGGPYGLYLLKRAGNSPKAIINIDADPSIVTSALIANIPQVYKLDKDPLSIIENGDHVRVDANKGIVEVIKKNQSGGTQSKKRPRANNNP